MSERPPQDGTHHRRTDLLALRAGRRDRLFGLAVAAVLILLNGVFALSELAVVSARKARLKTMVVRRRPGARAALALAEEPGRFLSTVQIGITLVGILAGAYSGAALAERFDTVLEGWGMPTPIAEPLAYALVLGGITYLSVVVGELGRVCKGCAVGWAPPSSGREALRVDGCAVAAFGAASAS